jgi:flavin reductase (DIM6/NTAB) family NADH-FMN oxidoreductase RutF
MADAEKLEGEFRRAMRRFAATVSVISTKQGAQHHAMTATAVTSLSMAPPSLLACIYGTSRFHRILEAQELFCVNVLYKDQAVLSQAFARSSSAGDHERFGWIDHDGFSYLSDAQAVVLCRKAMQVPFGTHTIFIGTVVDAIVRDDVAPLIFQDGQYGSCMPLAASHAQQESNMLAPAW